MRAGAIYNWSARAEPEGKKNLFNSFQMLSPRGAQEPPRLHKPHKNVLTFDSVLALSDITYRITFADLRLLSA